MCRPITGRVPARRRMYESLARECVAAIRHVLEREGDVAALIAEPLKNTPHMPPDWFWAEVRAACDASGTLLIFDEIPTGLGKTGRLIRLRALGRAAGYDGAGQGAGRRDCADCGAPSWMRG